MGPWSRASMDFWPPHRAAEVMGSRRRLEDGPEGHWEIECANGQPAVNSLAVQEMFSAHEASIRPATISKDRRRAAWSCMLLVNINSSAPVFSTNARIPSATTPGEPIAEHDST